MVDKFNLSHAAARKYQDHSVPAMFAPLAEATLDRVALPDSAAVLDVACGTGALTRSIAARMGGIGFVAGTDLNNTMIDVANDEMPATAHEVRFEAADVAAQPFRDATFDVAFVQQGLQFFPDKHGALAEIHRVLKPGGQLILTCWRAVSPFNQSLAEALEALIDPAAAEKARAPFSFRDADLIKDLLRNAGFEARAPDGIVLQRRFEDLRTQIMALPVEADILAKGPDMVDSVVNDVAGRLHRFLNGDVYVVPQEAHLFVARRP